MGLVSLFGQAVLPAASFSIKNLNSWCCSEANRFRARAETVEMQKSDNTEGRTLLQQDLLMKINPENLLSEVNKAANPGTVGTGGTGEVPGKNWCLLFSGGQIHEGFRAQFLPCWPPREPPGWSFSSLGQ